MADSSKSDPLSIALDKRLNELFREDEPGAAHPVAAKPKASSSLSELKKIVLSIDWEITPEALDSFMDQIRLLKEVYQGDKVVLIFLQILGSLGQYVKSSRSKVHPSTFSLLNSVFERLEQVVSTPKMPPVARRKLLQAEMDGYQALRAKISQRLTTESAPKPAAAVPAAGKAAPDKAPANGAVTPEMLARTIAELKIFIRTELNAIRQLIKAAPRRD